MNDQTLHIVLSSNERYMPGATVALAGIALNARPNHNLGGVVGGGFFLIQFTGIVFGEISAVIILFGMM